MEQNTQIITRRLFLKGVVVTVTAACLPGFVKAENNVFTIEKQGQFFNAHELTVLSDVAEIMIPRTDTPGAIDAQVAAVVDGLMLTWAGKQTQAWFKSFIKYLDELTLTEQNKPYLQLSLAERTSIIEAIDFNAFSEQPHQQADGYKHLKYIIFRVFYTSQQSDQPNVPVPGFYNGDLTLDEYNKLIQERSYA